LKSSTLWTVLVRSADFANKVLNVEFNPSVRKDMFGVCEVELVASNFNHLTIYHVINQAE
jgi:hypothetical protein